MQIKYQLNPPAKQPGLLRKLLALLVTAGVLALLLMFSMVLLAIILVVGSIAAIYLWWKTRELRRVMRMMRSVATPEARREAQASNDGVFEGEVIRVVDSQDIKR